MSDVFENGFKSRFIPELQNMKVSIFQSVLTCVQKIDSTQLILLFPINYNLKNVRFEKFGWQTLIHVLLLEDSDWKMHL